MQCDEMNVLMGIEVELEYCSLLGFSVILPVLLATDSVIDKLVLLCTMN